MKKQTGNNEAGRKRRAQRLKTKYKNIQELNLLLQQNGCSLSRCYQMNE
jgi:hypothetical protein